MEWWQIVLWILIVAVITAGLYAWGVKKSMEQQQNLFRMLYQKGSDKVLHYLKKHDTITIKEMEELVRDIRAGEFHSKNKAVVTKPHEFCLQLVERMTGRGFLEETVSDGKKAYRAVQRHKKER